MSKKQQKRCRIYIAQKRYDRQHIFGASSMRFEIADANYECNASLFIMDCLPDVVPDLSFVQKRAVVLARRNGWEVKKGERCRRYTWDKGSDEELDIVEIPEMAQICVEFDLYP